MRDLVFQPIISISIMSIFAFIMLVIILINKKHVFNRILILILVIIISQRPMLINQEEDTFSVNLDVIFVFDTTLSMLADDVPAETRLEFSKQLSKKIVNEFAGSRFAIISHNNGAYVKYPFTFNNAATLSVIDSIQIVEPEYSAGSSLSLPADYMRMLLNSSIITTNKKQAYRKKIVFFFADGELSNQEKLRTDLTKYNGMDELIDNGAIVGIGRKEGGELRAVGAFDRPDYAIDGYLIDLASQKRVRSYLNEDNLKELANILKLDYFNAESNGLDLKIEDLKGMMEQEESNEKIKRAVDIYNYFSLALTVLLVYELYYYRRNEA